MKSGKGAKETNHLSLASFLGDHPDNWQSQLLAVASRYNREYDRTPPNLPAEVEAMPVFQAWISGSLAGRIASPFWQLAQPKKNQSCLDLGCGISFLIYPWRDWEAFFYGQEISTVARDALMSRGPQLNSKLFKGVKLAPANHLDYEADQFDLVIATGVSCYFPLDYWKTVMAQVKQVLKPTGFFVFDAIDPDASLAENWAILETYLEAEVFLEPLKDWQALITAAGGKVQAETSGELFHLYKVKF